VKPGVFSFVSLLFL